MRILKGIFYLIIAFLICSSSHLVAQVSCDCKEYLYLNDTETGEVHKFVINLDSSLTEVGNPWMSGFGDPHGLGVDNNGNFYIGDTDGGPIYKVDCAGGTRNANGTSWSSAIEWDLYNIGSYGGYIFANGGSSSGLGSNEIHVFDPCAGAFVGSICLNGFASNTTDWGLQVLPDGTIIATAGAFNTNNRTIYQFQFDTTLIDGTCIDPFINPTDPLFLSGSMNINGTTYSNQNITLNTFGSVYGITTDGTHLYVLTNATSFGNAYLLKIDATTGALVDATAETTNPATSGIGWVGALGLVYAPSSDLLYISGYEDCISIMDPSNLSYIGAGAGPVVSGSNPKAVSIATECCPVINSATIDTFYCVDSLDGKIYLQDLINCDGIICEGTWTDSITSANIIYESCDNSLEITGEGGCSTFTLKSDGSGSNSICDAFYLVVNVCAQCIPPCTNPSVSAFAIQPSCSNGSILTDGYIQISSLVDGDRFHYSSGSTFNDNSGTDTYANASSLIGESYPLQIATGLSNPTGSQDYTIRVYNGAADCFTDIVVSMEEQDCSVGCNCEEKLYVNELNGSSGRVHKYDVNPDGTLLEINPTNIWYPNGGTSQFPAPHGIADDLNGNLYIGETSSSTGYIRRLDCEGNLSPVDSFSIGPQGVLNLATVDGMLIVKVGGGSNNNMRAYDLCTETYLGDFCFLKGDGTTLPTQGWSLSKDEDDNLYAGWEWDDGGVVYKFRAEDLGVNCISPFITGVKNNTNTSTNLNLNRMYGVDVDTSGSIYVVFATGYPGPAQIRKYDASGNLLAESAIDSVENNVGWYGAIGLAYSSTCNCLYTSNGTENDDCVSVFDTDLNYLGAGVGPIGDTNGDNAYESFNKALGTINECCPTNNNMTIDTALCIASIGDSLFLQDLINCNNAICEGIWHEGTSNFGLLYDACDNSIKITSSNACGTFTLESDGTGLNPQCGAFKITVNIEVINNPTVTLIPDSTICQGDMITLYGILDTFGLPNYQWQSSTTSCTTGFTPISGATDSIYIASPTDTTYYRLITTSIGNCASRNCADTSACVTVITANAPISYVGDMLKCSSNSETIEVEPSGGIAPYTYNWSGPSGSSLPTTQSISTSIPGTYMVTVTDANGCTTTASGELTVQSKICLPATFTIRKGPKN